jgi:hypothetical protein
MLLVRGTADSIMVRGACALSGSTPATNISFRRQITNICKLVRDAPDSVFAGYPANPKAGYRITGRILGLTTMFLVKY